MDKYIQRMKKALEDFNVVAKDCVAQDELAKQTDVENGTSFPVEMANELERLGIYEFEHCTFDEDSRRMTASVTTTLYRKGA